MSLTRSTLKATIASGAALSDGHKMYGGDLVGIQMPSAWTTANLTLQASVDGSTYQNVEDDGGTEVTITAQASVFIGLDPKLLEGATHLKIRSGTSGTAVNQAAERVIDFVLAHDIR
jgi:hypothetical protein